MPLIFIMLLKRCQNCDIFIGIGDKSLPNCDFGTKVWSVTATDVLNDTKYSIIITSSIIRESVTRDLRKQIIALLKYCVLLAHPIIEIQKLMLQFFRLTTYPIIEIRNLIF